MEKEVLAYLESHWDREWYKTFEEYRFRLCDVMEDIFQKLENNEINSFYMDGQTAMLDDYLEIFPEKTDYVKTLIQNKKLFTGPFYVLADEFLTNGESLCRNLLLGIKEAKNYGAKAEDFVGYLPDAFGHNQWMPMLLKKANINRALVWRGVGEAQQEFLWQSPDNSEIKTAFLYNGYYQDFFVQKSYSKNIYKLLEKLSKKADNLPIILPIGADHLACEDNVKAKIKNFNRNNKDFKIKLSSLNEYYEKTVGNKNLKKFKGEFRNNQNNYILASTLSSRVYIKQKNMHLQWFLAKVLEPMYAIMQNNNLIQSKKANFDYAWKTLIQNHAHDSICGCGTDDIHSENMQRFAKVEQICNSLSDYAKSKISSKINKNEIGVFNLSNYNYDGVFSFYSDKKLPLSCVSKKKMFPIEISQDIHNIPVQENYHYYYEYLMKAENLKGLSFNILPIRQTKKSFLKASETSLENEKLFVKANSDGTINIKNKVSKKEFKNLFKISDEADVGDSYNFSCILDDEKIFAKFKGCKIAENNELRKILRLSYTMQIPSHAKSENTRSKKLLSHNFEVDLILTENSSRLDIKINYENLSKDHILKINFELPQAIENVISEDTFAAIERKYKANYDYKKSLPMEKYKEIDININPLQRFVMSQGLCVLTKGLQEYEVYKNSLNITLLRSFGCIAKKSLLTRTAAAGPPLPTPEGQCLGRQTAELSLVITDESQTAFKEADYFYNPLVVVDGISKNKTELKNYNMFNLPENFYLYSLKEAENGNGFVAKIFNLSDKDVISQLPNDSEIYECNLLEEKLSEENLCGKEIKFSPNELKIIMRI